MIYIHLSLDEILAKVDEKYSREEQNKIAFELVDAMAYLAEYFSTGECKEWLATHSFRMRTRCISTANVVIIVVLKDTTQIWVILLRFTMLMTIV